MKKKHPTVSPSVVYSIVEFRILKIKKKGRSLDGASRVLSCVHGWWFSSLKADNARLIPRKKKGRKAKGANHFGSGFLFLVYIFSCLDDFCEDYTVCACLSKHDNIVAEQTIV